MKAVFDWNEVYKRQNAKILEEILDKKVIELNEMFELLNISSLAFSKNTGDLNEESRREAISICQNNEAFLINLISPWEWPHAVNNFLSLNLPLSSFTKEYCFFLYCKILQENYIPNIGANKPMQVCADRILGLMVKKGILPVDIARLPGCISDFFEDVLSYKDATIEDIVYHPKNYQHALPITLTYSEALEKISASGLPYSILEVKAKEKKIGVYLAVGEFSAISDDQIKQYSNQSIDLFRDYNCGNASYKTRYRGLEALKNNEILRLFEGHTLQIREHEYSPRRLEVESTDIEKKFHLQRYIVACVQRMQDGTVKVSNEYELKDVLFLKDDIYKLLSEPAEALSNISNPSLSSVQNIEDTKKTSTKKKRKRGLKHPEFYQYVELQVKNSGHSFKSYLRMMKNMGYVSGDYQTYKHAKRKDNSYPIIQDISIGRTKENKEVIFFRINGGSQIHEILMNTVENYFINASKKLHRDITEITGS
ncbi:hypothetical protein E3983_05450 [Legionella israelensis]|uniref:Uncharacterized protein n=1 Tax=Legionella israelensis TaxID=454 RepID=A0AAX1EFG1_9GAMM|nr:hypothetical protein [Legionella israelensis]QBR83840.1 hypothetical protein E3983_05450 [Legionella israelensis]